MDDTVAFSRESEAGVKDSEELNSWSGKKAFKVGIPYVSHQIIDG
jgi:hypothetical protein